MTDVAVLGTGTMGAPMAHNLLRAGHRVRVLNRTPGRTDALVAAVYRVLADARTTLTRMRGDRRTR